MKFEELLKKLSTATIANENVLSVEIEIKTDHKTITAIKEYGNPDIRIKIEEEYSI